MAWVIDGNALGLAHLSADHPQGAIGERITAASNEYLTRHADLLDVERPFVIAHEWAHLAGYADESEANFVAWLTCRRGDERARYSAALALIGYAGPRAALKDALDPGPRIDIFAIGYRYARTNQTLRFAARQGYDKYLKANRVERGVESYDAVVQLILGTGMDPGGNPIFR